MEAIFKPPKAINNWFPLKKEETKVAILLNHTGEEAQKVFQTFKLKQDVKKDLEKIIEEILLAVVCNFDIL